MKNNEYYEELNDNLKDEFDELDAVIQLRYLADEYHDTRSIKVACDLADALYEYFNR